MDLWSLTLMGMQELGKCKGSKPKHSYEFIGTRIP